VAFLWGSKFHSIFSKFEIYVMHDHFLILPESSIFLEFFHFDACCTRYWTVQSKLDSTLIETECANDEWPWSWFQFWMQKQTKVISLMIIDDDDGGNKHNPLRENGAGLIQRTVCCAGFSSKLFSYFSISVFFFLYFSLLLLSLLFSSSSLSIPNFLETY